MSIDSLWLLHDFAQCFASAKYFLDQGFKLRTKRDATASEGMAKREPDGCHHGGQWHFTISKGRLYMRHTLLRS